MPFQVTVAAGKSNVVLPDGLRHKAGDVVTLTDDEYAQLSASAISTLLTGVMSLNGLAKVMSTPDAGYALVNATPDILTWTVPNDGHLHQIAVFASQVVSSSETGGTVSVQFTAPTASTPHFTQVFPGGSGASASGSVGSPFTAIVQSGSTVTVSQTSALTAGGATVWAEIWGS